MYPLTLRMAAAVVWFGVVSGSAPAAAAGDCLDCHTLDRLGPKVLGASVHADLSCVECHTGFSPDPHRPPGSQAPRGAAWEACGTCHEDEAKEFATSGHSRALAKGSKLAPSCATCHGEPHAIQGIQADEKAARGGPGLPRDVLLCGSCHADELLAREVGINLAVVETWEMSMHGARARIGNQNAPTCTGCHGVHAIFRSDDPESPLAPGRRATLCNKCHEGADSGFARSFEHLATTREDFPLLYYIKHFFTWMITLTCLALAAHVFLDLQSHIRKYILGRQEVDDHVRR